MVNTNKVIYYLTKKHLSIEKKIWSHSALNQDEIFLGTAGTGLDSQEIEPINKMATIAKGDCSTLCRRMVEDDFSLLSSENFFVGESVTSFYMPQKF